MDSVVVGMTVVSVGLGLVVPLVNPVLMDSVVYVVDCIVVGTTS